MKKQITNLVLAALLLSSGGAFAQINLDHQVIGSTGGFATGTTITLSSTVGEAAVQSLFSVNTILTQGFQQPLVVPTTTTDSTITSEVLNASCTSGGSIFIDTVANCSKNSDGNYTVAITLINSTILLPSDSLAAGSYNVVVTGSNNCSSTATIVVGFNDLVNCELKFYSGITPNGDGDNDIWAIDNIGLFPENSVQIFNRWGTEVWSGEGYDNNTVVWKGLDKNGAVMPDATYFYVAIVAGETHKGWVEITR